MIEAEEAPVSTTAAAHDKALRDRNILILLWSLILAKCFAVEYFAQVYAVPVNTVLYVWTPTLIFALVASVVYLTLIQEESTWWPHGKFEFGFYSGTFLATVCTVGLWLFGSLNGFLVPAILSAIIGLGYFILPVVSSRRAFLRLAGTGWWTVTAILFLFRDVRNLLLFSLSLVALTVIPIATVMLIRRQKR